MSPQELKWGTNSDEVGGKEYLTQKNLNIPRLDFFQTSTFEVNCFCDKAKEESLIFTKGAHVNLNPNCH